MRCRNRNRVAVDAVGGHARAGSGGLPPPRPPVFLFFSPLLLWGGAVTRSDPSLAQLNLDSPQHALSNGYRVWGVKVTLGYEGKRSRVTRTSDRGGPAHGDRCLSWARSPHHLLRFCRSLFVLLGTCFARIVGALFATKVSFGTSPFGRIVAEISCAAHIENDPN